MVREGGPHQIIRQLPVEAGDVPGDARVVLETPLRGFGGAGAGELGDLDPPRPRHARDLRAEQVISMFIL